MEHIKIWNHFICTAFKDSRINMQYILTIILPTFHQTPCQDEIQTVCIDVGTWVCLRTSVEFTSNASKTSVATAKADAFQKMENILTNLAIFLQHHNSILLKSISFSCGNTISKPHVHLILHCSMGTTICHFLLLFVFGLHCSSST
jgi:hypothetical protein